MGRKPSKKAKNLPPRMRARAKAGGVLWYYYDCGGKPRKEIPLGNDYVTAIQKWVELEAAPKSVADSVKTFPALWNRYVRDELDKLSAATIRTHRSDIKHLLKFFGDPPAPIEQIRPLHIRQFLDWMKDKKTTGNRCKRLFSNLWNHARAWGWTDLENPCVGITGHATGSRDVYVTDAVYHAVWECATPPIQDAMDLAYLTGQRPADVLKMSERDIADNSLPIKQQKTGARVRIRIQGELEALIKRIKARKKGYKVWVTALLVQMNGKPLTPMTLRNGFVAARDAAAENNPDLAECIRAFWFYDLRAKAADDVAEISGESAAQQLLGHTDGRTTAKHYLRRGKLVDPTR
jgi:integrase